MKVCVRERAVQGDVAADARTLATKRGNAVCDFGMDEQRIDVEQVEQIGVLGDARTIVRHDPDAIGAQDAENRLECDHGVAAEDARMSAGRKAVADQHPGDGVAARRHVGVRARETVRDHARPVVRDASASVEIVDHPHRISASA